MEDLFNAARRHFGTWAKAIEAAGLDYDAVRHKPRNPYQTKVAIVRAIHARKRQGHPLTVSSLRHGPHRDVSLLEAALRRFGRWSVAMQVARRA